MKVYYETEPAKIKYEALPNGTANVYLRQNIAQETVTDTNGEENTTRTIWTADETQLITTATEEEVTAQFDSLILEGGTKPTTEERLSALEDAMTALMTDSTDTEGE